MPSTPEEKKAKSRAYYLANREQIVARACAYQKANAERVREYQREYQAANPEKREAWRKNAKPETRANKARATRARYELKREEILARNREMHYRNREARLAQKRAWAAAHRHLGAHYAAKRRAIMFRATPPWADLEAIEREYLSAALRTELTGQPHEVDHTVPLDSPLVCGLHVPANLKVVPRLTNRSKGNRHWPDMP